MKKSVAKNYIYNVIYQILVMMLPLITTPYISRILGAEGIGIYSYTISITTYFILFGSLGIAMYAQREIAYVQDNKEKRSKIFWEIVVVRFITLSIAMLIFYFTFARQGEYAIYYQILLLEIFANCFDISCFFQGMEEFKKIVFRNLLVKLVSIVAIFIFIKTKTDVGKYLFIYVISTLLGNLSLWFYLPQYIQKIKRKELNLTRHIKPTVMLFIPQIATQIYTILDKTMIGSMINDKSEVGFYEQSQKIVKMVLTIITSLGTVMLPRIANYFAKGEKKEIQESIKNSFHFIYLLAIPMMFGLMAISHTFIPIFLGEGYEKCITITYVISPILLMIGLSNVIGTQFLLPTKKQKQFTISVVVGAIVNLICNFIWIPRFMSVGAAIGTVVAETAVTVIQFFYARKYFDMKPIISLSKNYWLAGIIMLLVTVLIGKINFSSAIMKVSLQVGAGIIAYVGFLCILGDSYTKKIIQKIQK